MKTKKLTLTAMLIALTVVLALLVQIPVPQTKGVVTLCEVGIYTAALLLGPKGGLAVGGLSGLLIDVIAGYPQWAPFSLIIHGVEGALVGKFGHEHKRSFQLLGMFLGMIVMVLGYFVVSWKMYGLGAAIADAPGNVLQCIPGLIAIPLNASLHNIVREKLA
jgi:uncharacterized membrane protein